ncbi:MAG: carbamoyltransferase HypF [Candidatus Pseudobacter hemicellulosilyticus]|uniref:Carbamoyltransferase n=1 Tax=Candidatus Pseudobacter hemicellulosilyticus TaxID=3121375 RepID=A0AAJ5WTL0_9BACT|nr:MAG: carbamoyltransferase HypF [Pseudobacter sp.]
MNMHTYHIHISGLVQGVGFRPFVCRTANALRINGEVCNNNDGVHVTFNASEKDAVAFYTGLIGQAPINALVVRHRLQRVGDRRFDSFTIGPSAADTRVRVLLTPDVAVCPTCRRELYEEENRRYQYAFTTCPDCGPRYSIITALPFDRENTTMRELPLCEACEEEYQFLHNRRQHSQTNSCPDCPIEMHLYNLGNGHALHDAETILQVVQERLINGYIVAVKGVGGYLLLCDATNARTIRLLRHRKHRPQKPFALLYTDVEMAKTDVRLRKEEIEALESAAAPIVLGRLRETTTTGICHELIAPGLDTVGVMLPCSPLLHLISQHVGKPLVATSANMSGSPIIYRDQDALGSLPGIADLVLTYDRDIIVPQDDSVVRFSELGQKIFLRRSRGYAPSYFPVPFEMPGAAILAMGAELKSAFAILSAGQLYVSQYLGDHGTLESQEAYSVTLKHLQQVLHFRPRHVLIDQHPNYYVSEHGRTIGVETAARVISVQHHKAHFGAVLAENHLLETNDPILGIIWDGAGYGEDGQIWGGEAFLFRDDQIQRVAHLDYFPHLLGDKMSREPRLSALSLLHQQPARQQQLDKYFNAGEWRYYRQLLDTNTPVYTSSMGRLLDGIAAILGVTPINTYEGEGAMKLEALANTAAGFPDNYYSIPIMAPKIQWQQLLSGIMDDLENKLPANVIARKVYYSLAKLVMALANHYGVNRIACSGGVFQSALLTDMIIALGYAGQEIYFHQQLSPNDECIGFGQIACFNLGRISQSRGQEKSVQVNY